METKKIEEIDKNYFATFPTSVGSKQDVIGKIMMSNF